MGVGKWLTSLVGRKKEDKSQSREKVDNFLKKLSVDGDSALAQDTYVFKTVTSVDFGAQSSSNSLSSPTTSYQNKVNREAVQITKEDLAATVIQTAFRALLARRALRALKGIVRLQALVRGHVVRKQAAITLRCMQALVRVQACVSARQVCIALESQLGKQQVQDRQLHEACVREIEEGWCDSVGSVEEIQGKLLKRQEAAAKRERAMAYAITHQWQANSRHSTTAGSEVDKNSWGWNWLERWMAVRPWENRFLDINLIDGTNIAEGYPGSKVDNQKTGKKLISAVHGNTPNSKAMPSTSEGSGSSSCRSATVLANTASVSGKTKPKSSFEEVYGDVTSQPSGFRLHRSTSNKKENLAQPDSQVQTKRLSLPNSDLGAQKLHANRVTVHRLGNSQKSRKYAHKSELPTHQRPGNQIQDGVVLQA